MAQLAGESESLVALSGMAKTHGVWLIGGSIPEIERQTDKIYNTCTVYNPQGRPPPLPCPSTQNAETAPPGDLVVKHRKVHLFDIDIPGKQTFKESETLTGGTTLNTFETPFGKIGLGICYDIVRPLVLFPLPLLTHFLDSLLNVAVPRDGDDRCETRLHRHDLPLGIQVRPPSRFPCPLSALTVCSTTTGPIYWTLLQRARYAIPSLSAPSLSPRRFGSNETPTS